MKLNTEQQFGLMAQAEEFSIVDERFYTTLFNKAYPTLLFLAESEKTLEGEPTILEIYDQYKDEIDDVFSSLTTGEKEMFEDYKRDCCQFYGSVVHAVNLFNASNVELYKGLNEKLSENLQDESLKEAVDELKKWNI